MSVQERVPLEEMEVMHRKQNKSLNPSSVFSRYGWMIVPIFTNVIKPNATSEFVCQWCQDAVPFSATVFNTC